MGLRATILCGVALGALTACAPVLTSTKTNSTEISPRAETHPDLTYYLPKYFYRITFGPKETQLAPPPKAKEGDENGSQGGVAGDAPAGKDKAKEGDKAGTPDEKKDGGKDASGKDQNGGAAQAPTIKSRAVNDVITSVSVKVPCPSVNLPDEIVAMLTAAKLADTKRAAAQRARKAVPADTKDPNYGNLEDTAIAAEHDAVIARAKYDNAKKLVAEDTFQDYQLSISGPIVTPDPTEEYELSYVSSTFSDDKLTIQLTPDGLLDSVKADTHDRTADILKKIIDTGIEAGVAIATGVPIPSTTSTSDEATKDVATFLDKQKEKIAAVKQLACNPTAFSVLVDPSNQDQANLSSVVYAGNPDALADNLGIDIKIDRLVQTQEQGPGELSGPLNGVVFRPLTPFTFTIGLSGDNPVTEFSALLLAPDPLKRRVLNFERHAFVENTTSVAFVDGTLVGTDINKPSEFLEGIQLPLYIIERLLQVPGAIVKGAIPDSGDSSSSE